MHHMTNEFARDRTYDRVMKTDANVTSRVGYHMTTPGRALVNRYAPDLAAIIAAERNSRHGNAGADIWEALADFSDESLALNLVAIGLHTSVARDLTFGKWVSNIGTELGFRAGMAVKVGMWAANLLTRLPIFPSVHDDGGLELNLSEAETRELIVDALAHSLEARPLLLPLREPPVWAPASEGVALAVDWTLPALVSHHPMVADEFAAAIEDGPAQPVIDAVNWLQGTPFTINKPILNLLLNEPGPPPAPPKPETWQKAAYTEWAKAEARIFAWEWTKTEAQIIASWPEFFNPLKLDFRGRVNAIPQFAVQREDAVRALFEFKNGSPIGEDGIRWLKAHVAARAGGCIWSDNPKPDRLNLEGRIAWTGRHYDRLCQIGRAILAGTALADDDLPDSKERYQFARACVELAQVEDIGPTFETHLPLVFDASCSGLQHLSAMTRSDEGQYANLMPSETPTDLYQIIADHIGVSDLLYGIPEAKRRAVVKRPVMTFFYGSTLYGMAEQVLDEIKDLRLNSVNPWKIAKAIVRAIEEIITSAKEVRGFLEDIAGKYADANKPMRWPNPFGLPILNPYYGQIIEEISYRIKGKRRRVYWCTGNTGEIENHQAKVTANFIHSADAALLHAVALAAKAEGIELLTIHDCFGCIAPHASRLNEILREQLIKIHEYDWLQEVYATAQRELPGVELPAIPKKGNLDLQQVRYSFFAFS